MLWKMGYVKMNEKRHSGKGRQGSFPAEFNNLLEDCILVFCVGFLTFTGDSPTTKCFTCDLNVLSTYDCK